MNKRAACLSIFLTLVLLPSFGSQSQVDQQGRFSAPSKAARWGKAGSSKRSASARQSGARRRAAASVHMMSSNPPISQIGFLDANLIPTGGSDYSTFAGVVGDFNGDLKPDVATMTNTGTSTPNYEISVGLSNGDGTFNVVLTPTTATEIDPIFAGDLNGDGKTDLVMVHANGMIEGWISNGDGTFTSKGTVAVTSNPILGGTLFDVNGDGILDVMLADGASPNGNIWTLLGNGDGTFAAATSVPFTGDLSNGSSVVFADFNNDGKLDFAGSCATLTVCTGKYQVVVYTASGSGYVPLALKTPTGRFESFYNAAGNLSGHVGAADIISANGDKGNVTIYVNNGDGTFQNGNTGTDYPAGAYPTAVSIADMNGDGKNDVVINDQQAAGVAVLFGNGDGTVTNTGVAASYAFGGSSHAGAATNFDIPLVADFNGDHLLDVVMPDSLLNFAYLQGYGDGSFRSAVNYYAALPLPGGAQTSVDIASGDFNGDGIPDFVIGNANVNPFDSGITVFLSKADGSMQPGVNYRGLSGSQLNYVAVGDFNGDGKLDVAATDLVNGGVQIFTGNGDGTFVVPVAKVFSDITPAAAWGIVTGDFNGDGHPDLAVVNTPTGGAVSDVGILLNDAQGHGNFTLAPGNPSLSTVAQRVTAADLRKGKGDTRLDLVVPLLGTGNTPTTAGKAVAVLLGNGDGTFAAQPDFPLVNGSNTFYQPVAAAIADMNGDGIPDLVVGTDDQVLQSFNQGIVVALGNGDGTFQTPNLFLSSLVGGPDPMGIQITDLDRDGHLDVLTANYGNGSVSVLYGKGDGTLYDPVEYASDLEPLGLALADVNGDGVADVIASGDGLAFSGVTVLLNTSGDSIQVPTSSANPSQAGAPVTLTTTVAGSKVRGVTAIPTGSVTFLDGSTSLGSAPLNSSGQATLVKGLVVGSHSITAQYGGDAHYVNVTSSAVIQGVGQSPDGTALLSSANPAYPGQSVTFTATVASTLSGDTLAPTGQVTFSDEGGALGTVPLNSSGVATLSTSKLAIGSHSLTAQYSGDTNFPSSKSSALSQSVAQPDYSLKANLTSQTVNPGGSASYVITLTPIAGYDGIVAISCPTSLPPGISCNNPSIGPGNTQATLTVATSGPKAALIAAPDVNPHHGESNLWASLGGLGLLGMVLAGDWKKRNRRSMGIALGILAVVMILALVGCGSGGSSSSGGGGGGGGTPAGTYLLQISATGTAGTKGGNTSPHPLPLTLVVQ